MLWKKEYATRSFLWLEMLERRPGRESIHLNINEENESNESFVLFL